MNALPTLVRDASYDARKAFLEFFAARLRNEHTRIAYSRAVANFLTWCDEKGVRGLDGVEPIHVSLWVEYLDQRYSKPTTKQHLSALHMLFEWLAVQNVVRSNPARYVKGPRYSVRRGKTPVLEADDIPRLFESIGSSTIGDLRDRALIALMVFTFARVGAALRMDVGDVFTQGRRLWIRLLEKGGRLHEMPCHHRLEEYLGDYMAVLEPRGSTEPLFRSLGKCRTKFTTLRLLHANAYQMIQRRCRDAEIDAKVCCHSFRATGITTYLSNGGTIERAAIMANHASIRTTQLYDRRDDRITLDEVERLVF